MEQKIKDTNNRIDKEVCTLSSSVCMRGIHMHRRVLLVLQVAYLKTHMESSKLESIKYLVGRDMLASFPGHREAEKQSSYYSLQLTKCIPNPLSGLGTKSV